MEMREDTGTGSDSDYVQIPEEDPDYEDMAPIPSLAITQAHTIGQ